jgi:hypothetical protein
MDGRLPMHAVVVNVTIADGQVDQARKSLTEQVVPRVRTAPGFVKGYWTSTADNRSGLSMVVFRTEQDAKNAAQMLRTNPPPSGVTLGSVDVREVVAEA